MTTTLWVLQGLLAFVFLAAGSMKLMKSRQELADKGMEFALDFSPGQIKTIGMLELLGALGVILPSALGIVPMLAGAAAAGLALTMIGALITHIKRGEYPNTIVNVILGAMAGYVAYAHLIA